MTTPPAGPQEARVGGHWDETWNDAVGVIRTWHDCGAAVRGGAPAALREAAEMTRSAYRLGVCPHGIYLDTRCFVCTPEPTSAIRVIVERLHASEDRNGIVIVDVDRAASALTRLIGARLSENTVDSLDDAWREAEAALPWKRWRVELRGDWEDGWVADAQSWSIGGGGGVDVTTEGQGWGADRGGLPTPAAALHALAARLSATAASDASEEETNMAKRPADAGAASPRRGVR